MTMPMILTVRNPSQGTEHSVEDAIAFQVHPGDTTRVIIDQTRGRAAEFEGRGLYVVSGTDPSEVND